MPGNEREITTLIIPENRETLKQVSWAYNQQMTAEVKRRSNI